MSGGGNLRPAPLALTPALVAKLVGDRPAYGKGIVHVPFEGKVCCCIGCEPRQPEPDDIDEIGGGIAF